MSIIKFRKVRELFPNRKVRIVRTEQLCSQARFGNKHGPEKSLRFNGSFPGEPELVGVLLKQRMMEVVVTTVRYKSCKAPVKSSPPTNQHPVFLPAGCPSCRPTNNVKALKGKISHSMDLLTPTSSGGIPTLSLTTNSSLGGRGCHASHQPSDASTPTEQRNTNTEIQQPTFRTKAEHVACEPFH